MGTILYPSPGFAVIGVTVHTNNFIKADRALELGLIERDPVGTASYMCLLVIEGGA